MNRRSREKRIGLIPLSPGIVSSSLFWARDRKGFLGSLFSLPYLSQLVSLCHFPSLSTYSLPSLWGFTRASLITSPFRKFSSFSLSRLATYFFFLARFARCANEQTSVVLLWLGNSCGEKEDDYFVKKSIRSSVASTGTRPQGQRSSLLVKTSLQRA